jgi:RHS repeat-associated protein
VESYSYDEFGNPALFGASGQALARSGVGNPYLFAGNQFDSESDLYYSRRRYYDPRAGRFISRDPAGAWGDPGNRGNAFAYVGNNPATLVDVFGLSSNRPRPSDLVPTAALGPAEAALYGAHRLSTAEAAALAEAGRLNDQLGENMLNFANHIVENGFYSNEVVNGKDLHDGSELVHEWLEVDEAADAASAHYSIGNAGYWRQVMEKRIGALSEEAAEIAPKASRLAKAGKVLGVIGTVVQTGVAVYDDYKNCADAVVTVNDAAGTAAASGLVMAAPPLAVVDLATGGSVSGFVHNALITPGTAARVAFGDVNGRDAQAIKNTYTRFTVGRWIWNLGEAAADAVDDLISDGN